MTFSPFDVELSRAHIDFKDFSNDASLSIIDGGRDMIPLVLVGRRVCGSVESTSFRPSPSPSESTPQSKSQLKTSSADSGSVDADASRAASPARGFSGMTNQLSVHR